MAKRILVLGGTGAMGRHLSGILLDCGYEVYVTTRSPGHEQEGVRFLVGNAKDLPSLRRFVSGVKPDAIVDFMSYSTKEFAERFQYLLSASQQYVFLSSYRVFASECPLTERSPRILDSEWCAKDFVFEDYPLEKARQENILRGSSSNAWTIIRPAITYGEDRFQLGCMEADIVCYRALQKVPVCMPREMREVQTTLTYGKDVAMLISRLILNPVAYGEDYNCATSEHLSWGEVCGIFEEAIGAQIRDISIDEYVRYCSSPAQVYYDRMVNRVIDNRKVLAATGLAPGMFTPVKEGLGKALLAFGASPCYRNVNYSEHANLDRILHSGIALKGIGRANLCRYLQVRYPGLRWPIDIGRRLCGRLV